MKMNTRSSSLLCFPYLSKNLFTIDFLSVVLQKDTHIFTMSQSRPVNTLWCSTSTHSWSIGQHITHTSWSWSGELPDRAGFVLTSCRRGSDQTLSQTSTVVRRWRAVRIWSSSHHKTILHVHLISINTGRLHISSAFRLIKPLLFLCKFKTK